MKKAIVLFVFSFLFAVTAFSGVGLGGALVSLVIAALFFFFGWRSLPGKKKQPEKPEITNNPAPSPAASPAPAAPQYDFISFKLAGVTFKNGRKSRQTLLRAIKFRDGEFSEGIELELKPYEYEGQPAYCVFANGQQLGSVPKDMVAMIEENYNRIIDFSHIEVYGGGHDEDMNTKNYGCEVTLRLKKN